MDKGTIELMIQLVELAKDVGALKGERDALKSENEFLRKLLEQKFGEKIADET